MGSALAAITADVLAIIGVIITNNRFRVMRRLDDSHVQVMVLP